MNEDDAPTPPTAAQRLACVALRGGVRHVASRCVPEETAVAFTFNGSTHAVMMATPCDLEDFGVGFALTEGLIEGKSEISSLEVAAVPLGIDVRLWLREDRAKAYGERRRTLAGPTGCGLCGVESLEAAMRPAPRIAAASERFEPQSIVAAMAALPQGQELQAKTHAIHAAGFWTKA